MRVVGSLVIAATALFAAGIAVAATRHVMTVPLPDGAVARVEYEGEVAPRVTVVPAPRPAAAPVECWRASPPCSGGPRPIRRARSARLRRAKARRPAAATASSRPPPRAA